MKIARIGSDEITVTLSAGDAYRLSHACHAASGTLNGSRPGREDFGITAGASPEVAVNDARLFDGFGAAFLAAAVAAEDRMEHPVGWDHTIARLARHVTAQEVE